MFNNFFSNLTLRLLICSCNIVKLFFISKSVYFNIEIQEQLLISESFVEYYIETIISMVITFQGMVSFKCRTIGI